MNADKPLSDTDLRRLTQIKIVNNQLSIINAEGPQMNVDTLGWEKEARAMSTPA